MGIFDYAGNLLIGNERAGDLDERVGRTDADLGSLIRQLQNPTGPSQAELQMKKALGMNIATEQAFGATGRGNQALAKRTAAQGIGRARAGIQGDAAMLRAKEEEMRRQQLGGLLMGMRGIDLQGALGLAAQPTAGERYLGAVSGGAQAALGAKG